MTSPPRGRRHTIWIRIGGQALASLAGPTLQKNPPTAVGGLSWELKVSRCETLDLEQRPQIDQSVLGSVGILAQPRSFLLIAALRDVPVDPLVVLVQIDDLLADLVDVLGGETMTQAAAA